MGGTMKGLLLLPGLFLTSSAGDLTDDALFTPHRVEDVDEISQCRQLGVESCKSVSVNIDWLETSATIGDSIEFIAGTGVDLTLRGISPGSSQDSHSYGFSLEDGGDSL